MLTYGGIPLLLPDSDGELQTWLRQNQDIADGVFHGDTTLADKSPRRGLLAWGGDRKGIGQTVANYAAAPPPRINSLYWPTGATRWARGYFLCTGKNKNKITAQAHSAGGNSPLVLKWGDQDIRTPLTASMWLLPPRPISRVAAPYDSLDEQLWLLPLVDSRYWWQNRPTADLEISSSTTWADLFSTLGTALGVTVSLPTAVAASYLSPDTYEFTRRFESAALMLDAAALSVGKRIVRRRDGTVRAESNADAQAVITANAALPAALMAGGYYHLEAGYRPEKVTTTFRKWRYYRVLQKGQVYTVDKTPEIDTALATSTTKVVHSTMFADYSSDTSPPANTSDLDALAQVISDDFYGWMRSRYDLTLAGAQPWELNGFDDSVVWDFGRQVVGGSADGVRLGQTRVQSVAPDFGFDLQLSQKNTLTLFENVMMGKADSAIANGAIGTISIWTGRAGSKTDSTLNVEAHTEIGDIAAGQWVFVKWTEDDWEIFFAAGDATEIVEVYHSSADPGDVVEANASGYHPGRIRRYDGTTTYDDPSIDIWIQFVDGFDGQPNDDGAVLACNNEYYGPAKPTGETWDNSGDERPVYVVECSERQFLCKADSSISKGSSGTVSLYHSHDETDSGINRTAKALGAAITSGKWAIYSRVAGVWYVSPWECGE